MASGERWDPEQYARFRDERAQPAHDLHALLAPAPKARVVDLGCGSGELTAHLHRLVGAAATVGVDSSQAMLAAAEEHADDGVRFEAGDIATFVNGGRFDVVVSNAALHWVDDHPAVLRRWVDGLAEGGQLAVQVPANFDHPSHVVAAEVAAEPAFAAALAGAAEPRVVLAPERYAEILDELGARSQHVRLQVYAHRLRDTGEVVEWTKGTLLRPVRAALDDDTWQAFLDRYRTRLVATLGWREPFLYPFKRILFHASW